MDWKNLNSYQVIIQHPYINKFYMDIYLDYCKLKKEYSLNCYLPTFEDFIMDEIAEHDVYSMIDFDYYLDKYPPIKKLCEKIYHENHKLPEFSNIIISGDISYLANELEKELRLYKIKNLLNGS